MSTPPSGTPRREFMGNAFDPRAVRLSAEEAALVERRAAALGPAYRLFYERPLHIVQGEGVWLTDSSGRRYLDAYNNVPSVGHSHPHVVAALARQAAQLNTHTRYLHEGPVAYAERLLATLPGGPFHLMYTCTGSEANDLACRIAFAATGRRGLIVTSYAYHGTTELISRLSPALGDAVQPSATVRFVPPPRDPGQGGDVGGDFAAGVARAIAELEEAGEGLAALLVDTVFTSDANFVDPAGFLAPAAQVVAEAGGLFIADEVQPGFGRTGAGMWGYSRHGLSPDLVTMGKPMGNGHPIAAVAARRPLVEAFAARGRYFNTFGGNPVSVAVANAVLDVIEGEGLIENARLRGLELHEGFAELACRRSAIGARRGAGLAFAVDIVDEQGGPHPALARRLVNRLREEGVLISLSGPAQSTLKVRPPLCFGAEHSALLLTAVEVALGQAVEEGVKWA